VTCFAPRSLRSDSVTKHGRCADVVLSRTSSNHIPERRDSVVQSRRHTRCVGEGRRNEVTLHASGRRCHLNLTELVYLSYRFEFSHITSTGSLKADIQGGTSWGRAAANID
jgi:hypothetical protein